MKRPFIVGHRGMCTVPENTLKSFKAAIGLGVDMIELDVRMTKDKVPVIMHDDDVYRTTNGKGKINEMTLKELKLLDAGDGEQIPTLQEVVDLVKGKTKIMMELKSYTTLKPVAKLIKQNDIVDDSIIISFGHILTKMFKRLVPVKTGICIVSLPVNPMQVVHDANADYVISFYEMLVAGSILYKKVIKKANKVNVQVFAAEMDEKSRMPHDTIVQLNKLGVNGFVLNNPSIALKNLENKKKLGWW